MRNQDIKYFNLPIKTKEELRKQYRDLAKEYHPDINNSPEATKAMQFVNAEYDFLLSAILNNQDLGTDARDEEIRIDEALRTFIDQVVIIPGINIEIIGTWVWVTGNTYPVKEALKAIGMFFSKNKTAWYYHAEPYRKRSQKRFDLDDLRRMFDSQTIAGKAPGKVLRNPTGLSRSEINEMWNLAGKEPETIKNPTKKGSSGRSAAETVTPGQNSQSGINGVSFEEITRIMNSFEKMINWYNKKYNFDISKAPAKQQKEYNMYLRLWDELKAKRDGLKTKVKNPAPKVDPVGAAKQIRTILKKEFPGVKFEVTTSKYSGGNSVTVLYDDVKTKSEDVRKKIKHFQYGTFDGMDDSYKNDKVVPGLPQTMFLMIRNESGYIPNPTVSKAEKSFQIFMHYPASKVKIVNVPIEDGLVEIGTASKLDYFSDKMIFETDKKQNRKKVREFTHPFETPPPVYMTADRKWLLIQMEEAATEQGITQ